MISGTASATRPGLADDLDLVAELAAHAGAEELVVVDEHDARLHDAAPAAGVSSTSVPSPGVEAIVAVPPARAIRPSIDSASPRRSAGTAARSKPAPRSRTKTLTRVVVGLGVDRDLVGARELRRVRHRLARGEHDGAHVVVERAVAAARELDAHAVQLLDLGGRVRERADERVARRGAVAVEPAAQLALLPPRERGDAARLVGVALDQRERLQHRVVHARGDLGALLDADARRALGVALARELPEPRPDDEQQRRRARRPARGRASTCRRA